MRKIISAMKSSIDGRTEGPDGYADWVDTWSDDFGLTPQIDARVLGGGMYPNYEQYWTAIQEAPDEPNPMGGGSPTEAEVEWARFAAATPHYVLSRTLTSARWRITVAASSRPLTTAAVIIRSRRLVLTRDSHCSISYFPHASKADPSCQRNGRCRVGPSRGCHHCDCHTGLLRLGTTRRTPRGEARRRWGQPRSRAA
jgi:hypothetical protein